MKHKISAYHIPVFLYRRGLLILTLPLQVFLLNKKPFALYPLSYTSVILLPVAIIIYACIHHKSIDVTTHKEFLRIKSGVFFREQTLLPYKNIRCLQFSQGPLQKLLGICRVTIHTSLFSLCVYLKTKRSDFTRYLYKDSKNNEEFRAKSSLTCVLILSLGFYNALTGTLTLVPFFKKISVLSSLSEKHIPFLPADFFEALPILLFYLWILIFLLWLLGIVLNLLRFYGLTLTLYTTRAEISRGLLIRRTAHINKEEISALVLRQNLLMILINRYTGEFIASCKRNSHRITFFCAEKRELCHSLLLKFMKDTDKAANKDTLYPLSIWGYTYLPISLVFVFSVLSIIADRYSPYIARTRIGLFIILWLVGWFLFRLCIFRRCFASFEGDFLVAGCFHGLTYFVSYIPTNKIRKIKVTRSVFQKKAGTCSLKIYIRGQRKAGCFIKHTNKEKTAELLEKLCGHI